MLLRNRKLGRTNNATQSWHALRPINVFFKKLFNSNFREKVFRNNDSFFQKLDKKCFKSDAKEKLIRMETSGCFLLTCVQKKEF